MFFDVKNKTYYPFLDGFRAIAIIWVMLNHALAFTPDLQHMGLVGKFIGRIGEIGFFGVDIFFVISGFLITGLLIDDLQDKIRVKRFYTRRFFKIAPHYLLLVIVGLLVLPLIAPNEQIKPLSVISYLFFFQNYVPPISSLAHFWSLAIEEHFYLSYPLLLALICRLTTNVKARHILLFVLLITLIVAANFIRAYMFNHHHGPYKPPLLFQQTHMRFDALVFGCLIKLLESYLLNIPRWMSHIFKNLFVILGIIPFVYLYFHYFKYGWMYYTMVYCAAGFLIMAALLKQILLCFITELKFLRWIGKNSYGIYLWHYLIARIIFNNQNHITDIFHTWSIAKPFDMILMTVVYTVLSLGLGVLTTVTVEKYFLNVRKRVAP
ncbi:MAG: acyltransferase [Candidatus Omnitrophica bacterium]|nr:acyltransferase [Candidatus Omnitrophota bacterium]